MDSKVLFNVQYGLFVLSANDGTKDNACIINTVTQVTAAPITKNKKIYRVDHLRGGEFRFI